jgi:hypothetical protein
MGFKNYEIIIDFFVLVQNNLTVDLQQVIENAITIFVNDFITLNKTKELFITE